MRAKSGKKVGGQPKHKGNYRPQSDRPDEVVKHAVAACGHCGEDLTPTPVQKVIKRQVWDLPEEIPLKVVEHQAEVKVCTCCGKKTGGLFPENIVSPVQYGERLQALGVYLHSFHGIPYRRAAQTLEALFGVRLSVGTLEAAQTRIAERLTSAADCIYEFLRSQNVLCADETGARAACKN